MMPIPYPADTRAKGWRLELDYEQVEQSDTWAMASEVPMAQHALLMMWMVAWTQVPCGSFPNDVSIIRAKCRVPLKLWADLEPILMRGWVAADDGRLYHPTLTARVMQMMAKRRSDADKQATRRSRIAGDDQPSPPKHPRKSPGSRRYVTGDKPVSQQEVTGELDTGTGTRSNTALPTSNAHRVRAGEDGEYHGSPGDVPRDTPATAEVLTFAPSKAGEIGMALKRAGVDPQTLNLADPRLAALIAQGATADEFAGLAKEALANGINSPWPWILKVLPARRAEAAALVLAPAATPPDPGAAAVGQTQQYLAEQEQHRAEAASRTPEERAALLDRLAKLRANITDPTRKAG